MEVITGVILRNMLLAAADNLNRQRDKVNALNVFPVPDGDTGTNMSLTLNAAVKEIEKADPNDIGQLTALLARGSLMGARGNSGVILSQFFRGFSQGLSGVKDMATGEDLARALTMSSETTYRAVMKPVEGTMLTVGRAAALAAEESAAEGAHAQTVLEKALEGAAKALADTPNILPVLKEAGVVDAGGQGLLCIFEGFVSGLTCEPLSFAVISEPQLSQVTDEDGEGIKQIEGVLVNKYCTEFLILADNIDADLVRRKLSSKGDSMLVVGDADVVKVHIHTDHPGKVLEFCGSLGNLTDIKIDNMQLQNEEYSSEREHSEGHGTNVINLAKTAADSVPKSLGVVAVVPGQGLAEIFESLGVDFVVPGGQTMNPSTEDLVKAVNRVNAESVIILPNNKNVIFSAQQVRELVDKTVGVVPTRSVPQGIAALMYLMPDESLDENVSLMEENMKEVKTGEVTYAVRATVAGDLQIEEKDIIGLAEGKIAVVGSSVCDVTKRLIDHMMDEESSVISIYYGADQDFSEAEQLRELTQNDYPDCEVELYEGGQPLYYYIVSVE
ncbi:MAG: DAK2 domain-containing protein [Firmicutes bacterium]|nr:DAK2 domain-containing protein [Bacillota bacterium]